MKIAIDGRAALFYRGSGVGNYSYEIIKNLSQIISKDELKICNQKYIKKNCQSFWKMVNTPLILNDRYDMLLNPHNGIGLPEHKSLNIITTLHDIIPSKLPETVSESYLRIYNKNIYPILNNSDAIITVSNFSKEDICNTFNINNHKVFVTYLSPSSIYTPLNKEICKHILKKKYGIDYNYILYIGSFSPRKNILGLINAFSKISNKSKHIKLIIIGKKGKSYDTYVKECIKLNIYNKVIFTGFVETSYLPYFYNCAICFIYPSFYEGFGLPPLEAMACGTPSIVSNVTSMPEILEDSPIYINPYDIDDISNKIFITLNDEFLRYKSIKKSLEHIKKFSWAKTSMDTLDIIKKIRGSDN